MPAISSSKQLQVGALISFKHQYILAATIRTLIHEQNKAHSIKVNTSAFTDIYIYRALRTYILLRSSYLNSNNKVNFFV